MPAPVAPIDWVETKFTLSGDCWEWQGGTCEGGYGVGWHPVEKRSTSAHLIAYEIMTGVDTAGHVLDHLCRNRLCGNPDHLELVTQAENLRRGAGQLRNRTHCRRGHLFTDETTGRRRNGTRYCKECRRG